MTLYGFNKKDTTVRLRDFSDEILANAPVCAVGPTGREERYCKVTEEAIDAADFDGDPPQLGVGRAIRMIIKADGTMVENSSGTTMQVINSSTESLPVGKIVQVVREGKKWLVSGGTGGGSGGQFITQFVSYGSISAATSHSSPGAGVARAWILDGVGFSEDSDAVFDMVNPWEHSIADQKMITAYQSATDLTKYIIVQAECEEGSTDPDPDPDPDGFNVNDTTAVISAGTGQANVPAGSTWYEVQPTAGCCNVGGTFTGSTAQTECEAIPGTWTSGTCPNGFNVNNTTAVISAGTGQANVPAGSTWYETEPTAQLNATISQTRHRRSDS